jgi:hypothetical protein
MSQGLSFGFHFFQLNEQAGGFCASSRQPAVEGSLDSLLRQRLRPRFSGRLALEVFLLSVRRLKGREHLKTCSIFSSGRSEGGSF